MELFLVVYVDRRRLLSRSVLDTILLLFFRFRRASGSVILGALSFLIESLELVDSP